METAASWGPLKPAPLRPLPCLLLPSLARAAQGDHGQRSGGAGQEPWTFRCARLPASREPRVSLAPGVMGGTPSTWGPPLLVPVPSPSFPPLPSPLSRLTVFLSPVSQRPHLLSRDQSLGPTSSGLVVPSGKKRKGTRKVLLFRNVGDGCLVGPDRVSEAPLSSGGGWAAVSQCGLQGSGDRRSLGINCPRRARPPRRPGASEPHYVQGRGEDEGRPARPWERMSPCTPAPLLDGMQRGPGPRGQNNCIT